MTLPYNTHRSKHRSRTLRDRFTVLEEGFVCIHCKLYVPCIPELSGVQNRNHCPSCLRSRHLDGLVAGDRRSGCRAAMEPVGLTTKPSRNKYARERDGELMLVHRCTRCSKVITNRIAADDDVDTLLEVFEHSWQQDDSLTAKLNALGLSFLTEDDSDLVQRRLLGNIVATR